jgi:aspartate/methionine/tyrosine aminotransferase
MNMLVSRAWVPRPVPLLEENSFSFDLAAFDALVNEKTKLVMLNSPANPTGGMMPLADLKHIAAAPKSTMRILDEAGVALLSGTDFGSHGEGYLRPCYANSMENIERALARLNEFFAGHLLHRKKRNLVDHDFVSLRSVICRSNPLLSA